MCGLRWPPFRIPDDPALGADLQHQADPLDRIADTDLEGWALDRTEERVVDVELAPLQVGGRDPVPPLPSQVRGAVVHCMVVGLLGMLEPTGRAAFDPDL